MSFSDPIDLCKEYLHIKHQKELDKYDRYCADCELSLLSIFEPEPEPEIVLKKLVKSNQNVVTIDALEELQQQDTLQNQILEQLQQQVQKLETFNQQ
ncbi:22399_t:CDS:2 [Gigaspora margarita]|uniref:22399_t:CDS:1 n=1 Tax=Gigaspora margarita TaxID=4874 RepID=A0ABN7UNG7_GIGMA|nr:22399_t:CDS:2 [Gigaspora margarita]